MKVLVAEDDLTSRTMLQAVLRRWSYDATVVEDGIGAWDALQRPDAPRLAVLDWEMPGLDGLEVIRRVRVLPTAQPPYIILLTARGKARDLAEALEAGANDFVAKPFDPQEMRARLQVGQRMLALQEALANQVATLRAQSVALERLATTDTLTGACNRRKFNELILVEIERARRHGHPLSLLILDIDLFKRVNDTCGHEAGDEVLVAIAHLVRAGIRAADCLARWGGEEFVVLAPHVALEGMEVLAERLRAAVGSQEHPSAGTVTASFGVTEYRHGESPDEVFARADQALFRAKEGGRNRVEVAR